MKSKIKIQEYKKCSIKTGDNVQVTTGKEKGKRGKIIEFDRKTGHIKIEGLKMQTHFKKGAGIINKEGGSHISNVMLIDESTNKPSRYRIKIEENKKIRVSSKTGNPI